MTQHQLTMFFEKIADVGILKISNGKPLSENFWASLRYRCCSLTENQVGKCIIYLHTHRYASTYTFTNVTSDALKQISLV